MNSRILPRVIIIVAMTMCSVLHVAAQRYYSPNVAFGVKGGMTMSGISFTPSVRQSMTDGIMVGATFRYTEEKNFGLILELNFEQRGWKEDFQEYPFNYARTLSYIQIPMLTHIYFGNKRIKGFVNLGPEFSYMISSSTTANFDYNNIQSIPDFPTQNRMTEQLYTPVKNRFDYGISGGLGMEFNLNKRNSILLEGRYYFGLGNIFPAGKADTFSASRMWSIQISLGYMFRVK